MKNNIGDLKTYIMASYRFCKKVYDAGFDDTHFASFINLCMNHINNCNYICNKYKPMLGIIQYKQYKQHRDIYDVCKYTVDELNDIIGRYKMIMSEQEEQNKFVDQIALKARTEYELSNEFAELEIEKHKSQSLTRPIGFKLNKDNNNE